MEYKGFIIKEEAISCAVQPGIACSWIAYTSQSAPVLVGHSLQSVKEAIDDHIEGEGY